MQLVKKLPLMYSLAVVGCGDPSAQTVTSPPEPMTKSLSVDVRESSTVSDAQHPWRADPALSGKFHPEFPDDVQVLIHEGGPRLTSARPELVWVRVTGARGGVYQGTLLNQPRQLPAFKLGDTVLFLPANAGNEPFLVTEKYLRERSDWHIAPCEKCGMPELFDAPSDLMATIFPNLPADAKMEGFTTFCPICGGIQLVSSEPIEE